MDRTTAKGIEKHVLDDAVELIASVGLANPLMHIMLLFQMEGDAKKLASFLRALLGQHVILVVTRLHVFMLLWLIAGLTAVSHMPTHSQAERVGSIIGPTLGVSMIRALWFWGDVVLGIIR